MAFPRCRAEPGVENEEGPVARDLHNDEGQGTVEYVLVILAATAVALLLINWISGTDLFGSLFGGILGKIIGWAF